jgi:hypothetical protein
VRAGGGIGDEIEDPAGDPYEMYRIVFDITFFFFVIVILLAIIQGMGDSYAKYEQEFINLFYKEVCEFMYLLIEHLLYTRPLLYYRARYTQTLLQEAWKPPQDSLLFPTLNSSWLCFLQGWGRSPVFVLPGSEEGKEQRGALRT